MDLLCLGLNHQTAPVDVRERFAVSADLLGEASKDLTEKPGIEEVVVLSTCNRMEVYALTSEISVAEQSIKQYLAGDRPFDERDANHFYKKVDNDTARHLCRVVSGLDSMVLGETEIFGQVKQAYTQALEAAATGGTLNKLFQKSFSVGKKVRTQTSIQGGQTSVGSVAVDLAEKIFGHLKYSEVLVIGAGEMSYITAQRMMERGAKKIYVVNRSLENAQKLAEKMGGEAVSFDDWERVLAKVDVVVSSTGATEPVVRPEHVESVRGKRKYRPLFMIDIAMPRDIDPDVGKIEEVYVYDLDTLKLQADENRAKRHEQVQACEKIIENEVQKFSNQQRNEHTQ
ncbi:glutamyl-tRNA reductase [Rubritalea profundi]|uniref:Glutamyl-tRNA reductase n=1 Tax=Rubritalea profundi TaxID=1658618 RepID=A0A2S7TZF6_9BACT|nr:glutamyl-tRNA reductase [Rubritalea profundi]PQJ27514.1 glutamyl-tRNA reductase [Rubritalea profundi]